MTNPVGAFLPGSQASLEAEWKRELWRIHHVRFDALYCITNMPISRFLEWLDRVREPRGLHGAAGVGVQSGAAVGGLMCRNTISIGWDGQLYDCDFNQMLELRCHAARAAPHAGLQSRCAYQAGRSSSAATASVARPAQARAAAARLAELRIQRIVRRG